MLELVLLWLIPAAHLASNCIAPSLLGEFDLAALRVVGLRQSVINGHFSDGDFQNLYQVLNCLRSRHLAFLRIAVGRAHSKNVIAQIETQLQMRGLS